jgi:hypothetical protein
MTMGTKARGRRKHKGNKRTLMVGYSLSISRGIKKMLKIVYENFFEAI